MALLKCPECGRMISEYAQKCPNCAYPITLIKENEKHSTPEIKREEDGTNCWFCGENKATTFYEHTFSKTQTSRTTMMRKRETFSKKAKIPCCDRCKEALESRDNCGKYFGVMGVILTLFPLDIWLYSIEPAVLFIGIMIEISIGAMVVYVIFALLGDLIWRLANKELYNHIKRDIFERPEKEELDDYSRNHPITPPTVKDFFRG